ncbi:MAG: hypothetical protein HON05_07230 [Euryarchaeota archaeon]|jgi:hypothetical protein|nr:hypothetical protein [Euryarchaeota archaeon]MBT5026533.1 hypothetical protein [Euryarchaeota archaeon]MBT6255792.1 hypothetical protein [Euryarchaeota archaeon]MBT6527385.1 hypothetical protein [Euryarchaeota archaeon]MBT7960385.1 hypothetical protein [Euryarchaeota archaeon]
MAGVPEHVLAALRALSGYEQMLEMDRIVGQFGISEAELLALLQPNGAGTVPAPAQTQPYNPSAPFVPGVKEAPTLPPPVAVLDKSKLRFEYDPSQEAAQRRASIAQAIACPGCGAALGIPDVRPIKVICPQCLQETVFGA